MGGEDCGTCSTDRALDTNSSSAAHGPCIWAGLSSLSLFIWKMGQSHSVPVAVSGLREITLHVKSPAWHLVHSRCSVSAGCRG